jgi:hypothetical protein
MLVKGTALRTTLASIEEVYGVAGLAKVRRALPEAAAAAVDTGILASSSYPVSLAAALQDTVRSELGAGSLLANRRVGAAAGRIDFGGVYRVFLRASSYELLLRSMDRAFRQYNSRGTVKWSRIVTGEAEGTVSDVQGYTEPMWTAIAGRTESLLLLGGASIATAQITRFSAADADLQLRWR